MQQIQKQAAIGLKFTDSNRKGDFWEEWVKLNAWMRGSEVFQNAGSTGSVDMVIKVENDYIPLDIKSMFWDKGVNAYRPYANCAIAKGAWQVCVNPKTAEIDWPKVRGKYTCPAGLEGYWQ